MVDSSKRRSLKSIGTLMAVPLLPASLTSHNAVAGSKSSTVTLENVNGVEELSISLELNGTPMMRVSNNSSSLTILRRINPGVVVVGGTSYDLNHSLYSSAHGISAGTSRSFAIAEVVTGMARPRFPTQYSNKRLSKNQRSKKMLKIAQVSVGDNSGLLLNTSKVLFS